MLFYDVTAFESERGEGNLRVDGVLLDAPSPPAGMAAAIVSRLRIMAELDIAERRLPQDGRIRLAVSGRQLDVRVSTLPSLHGESVVLRLLGSATARLGIDELGMPADIRDQFLSAASRSHGIVLVTGPTGSGKTTTLYAALDHIRSGTEKILTVEDPVEYELPGAVQVSIKPRIGLTFASALRALLRQDPDVMLVGEIRDLETAEIAIHAALTGHLVLSTLHTNDAAGALTRLVDLGVEPYLVASTVQAVLAQRLVRLTCAECGRWTAPSESEVSWAEANGTRLERVKRGAGCTECRGTGYRGRTGAYALLSMSDHARTQFGHGAPAMAIRDQAVRAGMRLLKDAAVEFVRKGLTTPHEIARVTG
ncbi:MAG: GspE/PulE family protein [Gemmatimonadota bacterium]